MYGYYGAKADDRCPNCGAKGWEPKRKDFECPKCGYHIIETKDAGEITLIFCDGCGCTRSTECTVHPADKQHPHKT